MGMMRRMVRRTARRTARRQSYFAGMGQEPEEYDDGPEEKVQHTSDPVQRLKERLANGEITLEEYKQMMEAIK
jgi:uncharacterized membrane protein